MESRFHAHVSQLLEEHEKAQKAASEGFFFLCKVFKEMTFASKSPGFLRPPSLSPGNSLKLLIALVSETLRGKAQLDPCILYTDAKC